MKEGVIYLNKIIPQTRCEGWGVRYAIWVQGCSIRCRGCFAKHTWNKYLGRKVCISTLMDDIRDFSCDIDGITILGGEPFDQAKPLGIIAQKVQELGLSVITFTGYSYEVVENDNTLLFQNSDLIISEPYIEDLKDPSLYLIGSSNQRFNYRTSRFRFAEGNERMYNNTIEVRVSLDGTVCINGMGKSEDILFIKNMLI